MGKIPGWDKTRKDRGATVWVREEPSTLRISVSKVYGGWEVEGNDGEKSTSYRIWKTRKEAESQAIDIMKKARRIGKKKPFKFARGEVGKIERKARALMNGKWDGKPLDILYYYILEDANFHTENRNLTKKGAYGKFTTKKYPDGTVLYIPEEYGDEGIIRYKDYKSRGGRTFQL